MSELSVCDPHFHLWNIDDRPNPNLGKAVAQHLPTYLGEDYSREVELLPAPMKLASAVHVETVVGQKAGGFAIDTVGETIWVCSQLERTGLTFGIVAYVHLARDTADSEGVLERHDRAAGGSLRGIRMILNHHAENADLTWPQVESAELMQSSVFREGIALLGERDLSFDLQCNPHQLLDAARTFGDFPQTPVILNHLGLLHDGEDEAHEQLWREGMRALADLSHVCVKLSMLWFARNGYHEDAGKEAKVRDLVMEVVDMFGCDRCMFASNYPVEKIQGIGIETLYGKFLEWTADLSDSERSAVFHDTAQRVYKLSKSS